MEVGEIGTHIATGATVELVHKVTHQGVELWMFGLADGSAPGEIQTLEPKIAMGVIRPYKMDVAMGLIKSLIPEKVTVGWMSGDEIKVTIPEECNYIPGDIWGRIFIGLNDNHLVVVGQLPITLSIGKEGSQTSIRRKLIRKITFEASI